MDYQNDTYFGIDLGTTNTVVSKGSVLFNGLIQSQIIQVMQVDENKSPFDGPYTNPPLYLHKALIFLCYYKTMLDIQLLLGIVLYLIYLYLTYNYKMSTLQ